MGAQYIEGACVGNPVYNLAAIEGLIKQPLLRSDYKKSIYCTSEGRVIEESTSILAYHTFLKIKEEAHSLFSVCSGKEHGSLMNFLGNILTLVNWKPSLNSYKVYNSNRTDSLIDFISFFFGFPTKLYFFDEYSFLTK